MSGWRSVVAKLCGWLASIALAAMMLVTVADVVLRAVGNRPIRGVVEIVELLLTCTFFLALPAVFLRDENIVVDVLDNFLPKLVPLLKRIAALGAVVMLALIVWQGWISAKDTLVFGDVTSDLSIPRIVYWVPLLVGIAGAALAALAMAVKRRDGR
jgi:TRAP-type C4-dicarboxylate transport system permease small subunit